MRRAFLLIVLLLCSLSAWAQLTKPVGGGGGTVGSPDTLGALYKADTASSVTTPSQLAAAVAGQVKKSDSTTVFASPAQVLAWIAGQVKKSDSTHTFATPAQVLAWLAGYQAAANYLHASDSAGLAYRAWVTALLAGKLSNGDSAGIAYRAWVSALLTGKLSNGDSAGVAYRAWVTALIAGCLKNSDSADNAKRTWVSAVVAGLTGGGVTLQQLRDSMTAIKTAGIGSRGVAGEFAKWITIDSLDAAFGLAPGDSADVARRTWVSALLLGKLANGDSADIARRTWVSALLLGKLANGDSADVARRTWVSTLLLGKLANGDSADVARRTWVSALLLGKLANGDSADAARRTWVSALIAAAQQTDTGYLHLRAVEIEAITWTQLDSSVVNTSDKYPLPATLGFVCDSIIVETSNGAAGSVVPVLSHGLDISATGTSFGSLGTITSNTTRTVIVNTTAIVKGERVWLSFSSTATKFSKFSITLFGHRINP